MLKGFGIKAKILIAFLSLSTLSLLIGGVSYYFSSNVIEIYRKITDNNLPNYEQFIYMTTAQVQVVVPVAGLYGSHTTKEEAIQAKEDIDKAVVNFEKASKVYESYPFAEGEEKAWESFKKDVWGPFLNAAYQMAKLSESQDPEDQKKRDHIWENEFMSLRKKRIEAFNNLIKYQLNDSRKNQDIALNLNKQMNTTIFSVVILGFLISVFGGLFFANYLSKQLTSVMDTLNEGTTAVKLTVTQLSDSANDLAAAANQQAASVQETSASIEEIRAMVQKNASSAKESADVSETAQSRAEAGKHAVEQMIQAISEIRESSEGVMSYVSENNKKMQEITNVIKEIGNKTKVINDIVFQTKLLSFNASVEAARAGDQGKGFAVVAEEVGNLAQMSGNAAKEITELLDTSVNHVEKMVFETQQKVDELVKKSVEKIDLGSQTAKTCGETLDEIVGNVGNLSRSVGDISIASQEQANGVSEIAKAVIEIDKATQTNSAISDQTAQAANKLADQANRIVDASAALKEIVNGAARRDSSGADIHNIQSGRSEAAKAA